MESRDSGSGIRHSRLGLALFLTYASLCHAAVQSTAPADGSPRITVRVYNYAGVSRATLAGAEKQASRIFREAGIETSWQDCPTSHAQEEAFPGCAQVLGPAGVDVRIIPHSMAARLESPRERLGLALPSQNGFASGAWVFSHRVEELAKSRIASPSQVLACAMAHEIGHMLLGPNQHSSTGIMRAYLDREELKRASQGQLLFTSSQCELMRAQVMSRVQAARAGSDSVLVNGK
jgi:hypothetical protein